MNPRRFALVGGIVMLVMGVLALMPSLSQVNDQLPPLTLNTSYGLFLGIIPMNIINKLALIVFGLAGIGATLSATRSLPRSILFSKAVAYVMGAGAILGLIPATQLFFGYWPLYGADVALHAIFAAMGAYFGFMLTAKAKQANEAKFGKDDGMIDLEMRREANKKAHDPRKSA